MTTLIQAREQMSLPDLPLITRRVKKPRYPRAQCFALVNGVRMELMEGLNFEKPKMVQVPREHEARRTGALGLSEAQETYQAAAREHTQAPAWDVLDRHVLRFYGYFQEAVIEANLENVRTRQCVIYYYLEDDTCQVTERKVDNSGIPQGQLLRRHRFPGPTGGYLTWEDLRVGSEVLIYGRSIQLTDCDAYTRAYYASRDQEQDAAIPIEPDAFAMTKPKNEGGFGIKKSELSEKGIKDCTQFMEWDRKVCRFFAVVDDLSTPEFERRPFILLYFLADDTCEIREQYPLNCGRDNYPIFCRRCRLPKGPVQVRGPLTPALPHDAYVSVKDFAVNKMIFLMGQRFYIYDADEFTRQHFKEELGTELEPCQDVRLPERTVPRAPTPPYTGYGSWEDSLGSVRCLMPSQPKRDFVKLAEMDGKVLRFTARFTDPKPEDADRLFVICYMLCDDSMFIHEPPQRNLGIITGKFLEKGVHLNQVTGKLITAEDLYIGSVIKIHNREFEIIDMDEYTRKFIENGGVPRHFNLEAVLEKLREGLRQQYPLARDIFRRFDTDHDGVLTQTEFKEALLKFGYQLSEEEVLVLMKHFDTRQDGQISYNEFCDSLLEQDYTTQMFTLRAPLDKNFDPEYAERAKQRKEERAETDRVRTAVRNIGDVVYKQAMTFHRLLKDFSHMTHTRTVTCEQIKEALEHLGRHFSIEEIERCVGYVLPGADLEAVNYVQLLKALVITFHDVSGTR